MIKLILCPGCLIEWIEANDSDGACGTCLCGGYEVSPSILDRKVYLQTLSKTVSLYMGCLSYYN